MNASSTVTVGEGLHPAAAGAAMPIPPPFAEPLVTSPLVRHLAVRMSERQIAVFDLVTMDAARRLAKALLDYAEKFGRFDDPYLRVDQRISHEELSQIVGTTRPRVTAFKP